MSLRFSPPAGASRPHEPYVPPAPDMTGPPEGGLIDAVYLARSAVERIERAMSNAHTREAEDYRVRAEHLEALDRAATALNTATAIYRARRNP